MNNKSLTSEQLKVFQAVAELGGFSKAAQALGCSKSAVSQTIKGIEAALQVPLLIRTTRSCEPTPEGQLLLAQCQRISDELEAARHLVASFHEQPSGKLRISCNPYWAERNLLALIEKYLSLYPKVSIDLIAEERMPDMRAENIDLVFGINWPAPDYVVAKKIGHTRYVVCASPAYLEKNGTPKTHADLSHHRYIPHYGRSHENLLIGCAHAKALNMNLSLTANNANFMKQLATRGLGIVQLHEYMVDEALHSGELVELFADAPVVTTPIYIYYQKHRFVQPKLRQFVNLLS